MMTLNEFKAWLDGFSAAMGDAPTAEQWATIRDKLEKVQFFPYAPSDPHRIGQPWPATPHIGIPRTAYPTPRDHWPMATCTNEATQ